MHKIVIKLHRAADLSGTMKAIRFWLDDHRCRRRGRGSTAGL
jgi:hypothetical protein